MTAPVTARILLPDQSAVRAAGLVLRKGRITVLDDLDLTVPRNTLFGIAGRSGSGKSALLALAATLDRPTAGELTVLGIDPVHDRLDVRRHVGYLPSPFGLPPNLRIDEYLHGRAAALGVGPERWDALVETLLNLVGLAGRHAVRTNRLSEGARQLLGVASTLVHDPTLVLLDEPTRGLDERDRAKLWNLLHRLLDVGRTVVVTSRHLPELASGCAEIAVLDDGRTVAQGPPTAVVGALGGARRIRARLVNGVVRTHTVADAAAQAALLRKLVEGGVELLEFAEVPPDLDDLGFGAHPAPAGTAAPAPAAAPGVASAALPTEPTPDGTAP